MTRLIGVIYASEPPGEQVPLGRFLSAVATILLAGSGCGPTLSAQSPAPPGRTARLDEIKGFWGITGYRVELSAGVALAVNCTHGGPCEKLVVTSDDPAIAEVHAASLGKLESSGLANQATSAAVVLVGKTAGTTKLHVRSKSGNREIAVTIIPPPAPSPPAAVAR